MVGWWDGSVEVGGRGGGRRAPAALDFVADGLQLGFWVDRLGGFGGAAEGLPVVDV